ncbi:MAG TPA: hypothetical protein VFX76_06610, partial [Roseiflexaceae bacterium]|nr:hypothetical protein [Roseiflexaceae bacterium]
MLHSSQQSAATPPDLDAVEVGRGVLWVGLMAGGVACGAILVTGISQGITARTATSYAVLTLIYLGLVLAPVVSWP